ncbi:YeeE/YedE family protein [Oricola sp.]|uniref:YeeE/YedE family protein n=1 Tax=Oricola sp. TaxID=1979950 RepID=UPI003BAAAE9D
MDFVPLIDAVGESSAFALIGLTLGMLFGATAERTGFCTRSAVLELSRGKRGHMLPLWLLAFATTVLATQLLIVTGQIDVLESRFFGTAQSLSGAAVGGALFGAGMVLTRGCASRLLVLGASGNLRALFSIAIIAVMAWATFQGPLVPLRNAVAAQLMSSDFGSNDLAVVTGTGANAGLIAGVALAVLAIAFATFRRLAVRHVIGGLAIGALIPAGWYLIYQFSLQVFEPIQPESLSYMRPLANTVNFVASGGDEAFVSFDIGLIGGTFAGALVASLLFRSFRIHTFADQRAPRWPRYALGSVLMGFGGILSVGCTIGAGFTGGAVLAFSSLTALLFMILSAAVTDRLVDRRGGLATVSGGFAAPAE